MSIHKVGDEYILSSSQVWVPGVFADHRTANYALRFTNDTLQRLQDTANERNGGTGGIITYEDLAQEAKGTT